MSAPERKFVTARIGGQLVGIPIARAREVFSPQAITPVPAAGKDIAGVLNLRGRIVTMIDLRSHFAMPAYADGALAIGVDEGGDSYGLMVDALDEVRRLATEDIQENPVNLDEPLRRVSAGVCKVEDELLVVLDVDRILKTGDIASEERTGAAAPADE